jgi:hypothetical protein
MKPTLSETAMIVEYGEARAMIDTFNASPPDLALQYGLQVTHFGSAVAVTMKHVNMILFNRVMGLGLVEPITEDLVQNLVEHFRQHAAPNFAFQISPAVDCPQLPHWLSSRGLQFTNSWARYIRSADSPPAVHTNLTVKRIDSKQAEIFADVFKRAYGLPDILKPFLTAVIGRRGWAHYLAFEGDIPVASGVLHMENETGWFGMGSTLPSHRHQGAQSAIIARRIADAQAENCRWLVAETAEDTPEHPNPSSKNLVRLGFQLAYLRPNYEVKIDLAGS